MEWQTTATANLHQNKRFTEASIRQPRHLFRHMVWQDTANYRFAGIFASRTPDCRVAIDISPRRSHPDTDKNTTEEPSEELIA